MKKSLLLVVLFLYASVTYSQEWVEKMQDPTVNFYEVQQSFNDYWADKEYEKGKGYKQFKRWEYMMEPRITATGERPVMGRAVQEYLDFQRKYKRPRQMAGMRSTPNGEWTPLGPFGTLASGSPGVGRVNVIIEDYTDPDIVYAGTPGGGLWKSTTGGGNWVPMTDDFPTLGVSGIALDPDDNNTIYIGTGDGNADDTWGIGVLKSTDGGLTWGPTGLSWEITDFKVVHKLIFSPYDSNVIFCAASDGLYKSINKGDNWNLVLTGKIYDVEFHPTDSDKIYASRDRLFMSTNGGEDFNTVSGGLPFSLSVSRMLIAVTPDEPNYVYTLSAGTDNGFHSVHRSTDAGVSFEERSTSPNILGWSPTGNDSGGQAWYDLAFACSPTNANRITAGGVNVWGSGNGGSSWSLRSHWVWDNDESFYTHADIHWLEYFGGTLWAGTDGGTYKSENDGFDWTDESQGLANSQFYRIGSSQTEPGWLLSGAQDNGTTLLKDGVWRKVCGGDGMEAAITATNENVMYCASQYGNIRRSLNGGNSFSSFSGGIDETGAWVTPYQIDPNDPNTVYAGYERMYKRTGNGGWQAISAAGATYTQIEVADGDSDVIYAARDGSLSRTINGGQDWTFINGNMPPVAKSDIDTRPGDAMEVWVTLSAYGDGQKVFRSFDGGETYEDMTLNLPAIPCNAIELTDDGSGGAYVGMDVGVYYYDDNLANWIPFDDGMPKVIVNELEIQYSSGKLRAATYGRGLWETDLYQPTTALPSVDFEADRTIVCPGQTVIFSDLSIEATPGWSWTFEGGTPSTSNEQSPEVTFAAPGEYEVTLTVDNDNGEAFELKTQYIKVLPLVGEEFPYTEDFETFQFDESDRWFREDMFNNGITWERNESVGSNSTGSMWIDNYNTAYFYRDRLVSNTIDLSEQDDVVITFDVANARRFPNNNDRIRVYTSSDCGDNWSLRESFSTNSDFETGQMSNEPFVPNEDEWVTLTVDGIPDGHYNENFRMMFEFENGGGNNIYIDNINIVNVNSVSDLDVERLELSLFPNPAQDNVTLNFTLLESTDVRIDLIDMVGRRVLTADQGTLPHGQQTMNLNTSALSTGVYMLQLQFGEKAVSRRLIID